MSKASTSTKGSLGKIDPTEGFNSGAMFYDMKKFPRGFNKYGEFTKDEASLLHEYGRGLQELEKGEKSLKTSSKNNFWRCVVRSVSRKLFWKNLDEIPGSPES